MSDFELMLERKKEEKRKRRRRKVRAAMELSAPKSAPISASAARYLHLGRVGEDTFKMYLRYDTKIH